MNSYLKLVHMEVHRFRYILASLMALTMLVQITALIWLTNNELARRTHDIYKNGLVIAEDGFHEKLSFAQMIMNTQRWYTIPILLAIAVLTLYVLLIWYRDWFGRNTFIYRLLMLPTARRNIYWAKLTAIIIFIFAMLSFQLLLLPIQHLIFTIQVPSEQILPSYFIDYVSTNRVLKELLPHHWDQFVISYGLGIMGVISVFTAILIERSYRLIGIVYAIVYLFACLFAVFYPLFAMGFDRSGSYLYREEIFAIEALICVIIIGVSIWLALKLLNKKITV